MDHHAEAQETVIRIGQEIGDSTLVKQDWSETICAVPHILEIMGEAMVLGSVPNAARVKFSKDNIRSVEVDQEFRDMLSTSTLPTCLFTCYQIGERSFVTAHTGMTKIQMYSASILPLVDGILRVFEQPLTTVSKFMLTKKLGSLEKSTATCTAESERVKEGFDRWYKYTSSLAIAVQDKSGQIGLQRKEQAAKIETQDGVIQQAEVEVTGAEAALSQVRRNLQAAYEIQARVRERSMAQMRFCMDLGSPGFPVVDTVGIVAATTNIALREIQVAQAQQEMKKKQAASQAAAKARTELCASMKVLQNEQANLNEILKVLHAALDRLMSIQQNVRGLLIFFTNIGNYVELLAKRAVDHDDDSFWTQINMPIEMSLEERDEILDREVQLTAVNIKTRFLTMNKIAETYALASEHHILPGFEIIGRMTLSEKFLSDGQVANKSEELTTYRDNATRDIRALVLKRQEELRKGMEKITQDCYRSVMRRVGMPREEIEQRSGAIATSSAVILMAT